LEGKINPHYVEEIMPLSLNTPPTWFEQGMEEALTLPHLRGVRNVIRQQMTKRFGELNADDIFHLYMLSETQLMDRALALLELRSKEDLALRGK
jgi:hypothetical protein